MQVINNHFAFVDTILLTARALMAVAATMAMLNINVNVNLISRGAQVFAALASDAVGQLHQFLNILLNHCQHVVQI